MIFDPGVKLIIIVLDKILRDFSFLKILGLEISNNFQFITLCSINLEMFLDCKHYF